MGMIQGRGYFLPSPGQRLEQQDFSLPDPGPSDVIVAVAGCGICHTDIGFAKDGVATRHALPLILGHEISGRVIATGERAVQWLGKQVIVPAVIPCGDCPACRAGRSTICRKQYMPGNDGDGGFATHVRVPESGLCPLPDTLPSGLKPAHLSVVADAITTPYEAVRRAELGKDDVAVFVGVGGVGGFGVQIAAAHGAAVVAVDVDQERLDLLSKHGAALTLNASQLSASDLKAAVRLFARQSGRRGIGLKIFETSGTTAGQQTAFSLLDHGGYLAVIGFTPQKIELRLSNLMAFDATARGNWGCPPEQYPPALALVLEGKVQLAPFVELHPLEEAPEVFEAVAAHAIRKRVILTN